MSWLKKLTPTNLLEERQKFFSDFTYNPQFTYEEAIEETLLTKYNVPQPAYLNLAQEILDKAYFGRNEADLILHDGKLLTESEVTEKVYTFLKMHNLEDRFSIIWSNTFVARATISTDTIKLRSTSEYRQKSVIGMIYHEVGTHALRRVNYEQQPWYKRKSQYNILNNYLKTEEGLAALHSLLPQDIQLAYSIAIRYLATNYALSHSFAELWHYLKGYISDLDRLWMVTFRQKRGLEDTSLPGGYSKDLVYFEGFVDTWKWLKAHDFNPELLYLGKIALEDIPEIIDKSAPIKILPSFYTVDPEKYKKNIEKIGEINMINQL
jgi:hypothetical protein